MSKRRGGMLKLLVIVLPVLLIVGGVVGAAMMGKINIPGLTPKKPKNAASLYGEAGEGLYGETEDDAAIEMPAAEKPVSSEPEAKERPVPVDEPIGEAEWGRRNIHLSSEYSLDANQGARKLAKLWNEMETSELGKIVEHWTDEDIATILSLMDPGKAADLLGSMESKRAAAISEEIQFRAALVPKE